MIAVTLAELADIVGGRLHGLDPDLVVRGKVEFDSRRIEPGDVFLAIPGERVDGHAFAGAAFRAGAVAVIASRAVDGGCVLVPDPVAAITSLASAAARRLSARVVGITGSSGKTSTKDLTAQVLRGRLRTVATPGSFNNELGHPYTVLLADESTEALVLELSARGPGHIRHLAEIAPPTIGAVLNVGSAHLGEFGDIAVTARSKGELVEALPAAAAGGVAVLNADDALVTAMAGRTKARVLWVGEHQSADVRADNVRIDERGRARFDLLFDGRRAPVTLRVFGEHQVANALSAAGVGIACGLGLGEIAAALSEAVIASPWRMQVVETADGTVVVNDSYNANPESMRAAFKALVSMSRGRRSVALLGHMAELGPSSRTEHDALGRLAVRLDISQLVAVGEQAKPVAHGAALEGSWNGESEWSSDVAALIERLPSLIRPGDVVLVKGSRSAGMERVADAVIAHAGGAVGERGQAS